MTIDFTAMTAGKSAGPAAGGGKDTDGKGAEGLFAGLMALMRADTANVAAPAQGQSGHANASPRADAAAGLAALMAGAEGGEAARGEADAPQARGLKALVALLQQLSGQGSADAVQLQAADRKDGQAVDAKLLQQIRDALAAAGAKGEAGNKGPAVADVLKALRAVAADGEGKAAQGAREMLTSAQRLAEAGLDLKRVRAGEIVKLAAQAGETRVPARPTPAGMVSLQASAEEAGKTPQAGEGDRPRGRAASPDASADTPRPEIKIPDRRTGMAAIRPTELRPQPQAQQTPTQAQQTGPVRADVEGAATAAALRSEGQAQSGTAGAQASIGAASGTAAVNVTGAPASPTPAGARAGMAAQQTAQQIAAGVQRASANGQGRVQIQLHPRELGRVDVRMEFVDDGLRVRISVERAETLDMMNRDARALERALQEAGVRTQDGGLSFDLKGQGRHAGQGQGERTGLPGEDGEMTAETETAENPDSAEPRGGWTDQGRFDLTV